MSIQPITVDLSGQTEPRFNWKLSRTYANWLGRIEILSVSTFCIIDRKQGVFAHEFRHCSFPKVSLFFLERERVCLLKRKIFFFFFRFRIFAVSAVEFRFSWKQRENIQNKRDFRQLITSRNYTVCVLSSQLNTLWSLKTTLRNYLYPRTVKRLCKCRIVSN